LGAGCKHSDREQVRRDHELQRTYYGLVYMMDKPANHNQASDRTRVSKLICSSARAHARFPHGKAALAIFTISHSCNV